MFHIRIRSSRSRKGNNPGNPDANEFCPDSGNLDEGPISGAVENESKQRTFRFEGTFRDGEFRGTHAEIKRTGERRTGSLTLVEKR